MKYLFVFCCAFLLAACGGDEEEALPATFTIAKGSNLYEATAVLCGSTALDKQGRGRWRRWIKSDERIARAPVRQDPKIGSIVVIPAGTYKVPRNLCANETASFPWLIVTMVLAALGGLYLFSRATSIGKKEELGPVTAG